MHRFGDNLIDGICRNTSICCVQPVSSDVCEFFRDHPLGGDTCSSIVKKVCSKSGIRGCGESSTMTAHGLRASMISILISAGYSDAAVVLRTGHRDTTSLQSFHNLREGIAKSSSRLYSA